MEITIQRMAVALLGAMMVVGPQPLFPQAKNPKGLTREQVEAIHGRKVQSEEAGAIPAALARETGDVYIHAASPIIDEIGLDPKNQLANWMRHCDLVALGKIGTGTAYMTARQGFVNTDWSFEVTQVVKNNPQAPVDSATSITVIAFGGRLKIGQRTIHAIQKTHREFKPGEEYLLFLKFVPETGAYSLSWPIGFGFSGMRTVPLVKQRSVHHPEIEAADKAMLIRKVKDALN
jgi:hypothetical protein